MAVTVLPGCPSPDVEGKYDGFLEETQDERDEAQNTRMDVGGQLADVTGTFLFALDTIVSPGLPLQFIAEVTFTPEGSGGMLAMELQPLALNQGSQTEPRTPVGDVISIPATPVDESGAFTIASLGELRVTGVANPITGGDIRADVSLDGNIFNENIFCGSAGGEVFEPLPLMLGGSTFGAERIDDTSAAALPTDIVLSCPEGGAMDDGGSGDDGGESTGAGSGG